LIGVGDAWDKQSMEYAMNSQERLLKAVTCQQQGEVHEAERLFREELALNPNQYAALYSMAAIESQRSRTALALDYIDRALRVMPRQAMAHHAKGVLLNKLGRGQEALLSFQNAKRCEEQPLASQKDLPPPRQLEITHPMQRQALQFQSQGDMVSAKACFEAVIADLPGDMLSLYSLMVIASQQGRPSEALALIDEAIGVMSDYAPAHFARGTLLQGMGLFDAALLAFDQAILLQPDYLEALNNRASLLQALNKIPEAYLSLVQALHYKPQDEKILMNTGVILTTLKKHGDAVKVFDQLIQINPDYDYAQGYRFFAKLHTCDWRDFESDRQRIIEGIRAGKRLVNPLAFFSMCDDPALHLRCAQLFTQQRFGAAAKSAWEGKRYKHNKLRVGYVSPDLREHPVGHLLAGVIEHHDKTRIETFAFSLGIDDGSSLRRRFKLAFDHFIDCKEKTSGEVVDLIRAAEIDVLIDLAGYTAGSKSEIFAARAAPVQINYLGYPGSMGAPWMDFILADHIVIPKGAEQQYEERVLRLPHCYLPLDDGLAVAAETPRRSDYGLPEKATVFCSFNHDYKINPPVWRQWMELLHEHPQSVLWLMKLNDDAMANLRNEASAHDFDPNRLVFATRVPRVEDHLARYRHAKVFLDTAPYNAYSTATDVSRAGVPFVTLKQRSFASRVAASVLHTLSLDEGRVVTSYEGYWKAVHLALDQQISEIGEHAQYPSTVEHAVALELLYAEAVRLSAN